ncbi:hypothetical protein F5880DRAFT_1510120 [Lentinula raphanica]|nr:hypothetical protein F5880DRAFT_1510120 [Lentinula raphanica]
MLLVQIQGSRTPRTNPQLQPDIFESMVRNVIQHPPPNPPNGSYIPTGDFVLFIYNQPGLYYSEVPPLSKSVIQGRTTRPSVTATNQSGRSSNVRNAVRSRDAGCRISGFLCPSRNRGRNYKGFQVAHIFPLAYVEKAYQILPQNVARRVSSRQAADHVTNAILLRSDIHDQFDDYQISCRLDRRLVRFERNGAPNMGISSNLLAPTYIHNLLPGTPNDFDSELMQHHYRTAVLLHVAGYGRELGQ